MMDSLILYGALGMTGVAGLTILALIALRAFGSWLDFKRAELQLTRDPGTPSTVARIDIADLKERIRKLEAIAAGVDF